jgi:hypothetical protein
LSFPGIFVLNVEFYSIATPAFVVGGNFTTRRHHTPSLLVTMLPTSSRKTSNKKLESLEFVGGSKFMKELQRTVFLLRMILLSFVLVVVSRTESNESCSAKVSSVQVLPMN